MANANEGAKAAMTRVARFFRKYRWGLLACASLLVFFVLPDPRKTQIYRDCMASIHIDLKPYPDETMDAYSARVDKMADLHCYAFAKDG